MWPKNSAADDVRRRAAGSRMAAARRRRRFDGMNAQLVGDALQKFNVSVNHEARSLAEETAKAKNENRRDRNVTAAAREPGMEQVGSSPTALMRVSAARRANREFSIFEIWQQILHGGNGFGRLVFFQGPLLFGRVNLAEIVDASVSIIRFGLRLLRRLGLLELGLLLLGKGARGLQLLG